EMDPLSLAVSLNMGLLLVFTGRYDQAIIHMQRIIELEPTYFIARNFLALCFGFKSMFDECIAEYERAVKLVPGDLTGIGLGYALSERHVEARAILDGLEDSDGPYASPVGLAQIHLTLGEKGRALELLERGCEERDPWSLWIKVNPVFESVRTD